MNPRFAAARRSHGAVLAQLNRLPEAIREFEAALEIDPTLDQARNNLARALVQSGHIPEAVEQLQKVLQYHPDDAQAQQNLASNTCSNTRRRVACSKGRLPWRRQLVLGGLGAGDEQADLD